MEATWTLSAVALALLAMLAMLPAAKRRIELSRASICSQSGCAPSL